MHIKTSELSAMRLGIGSYTCNWGTHICGLYSTAKERDEIIFGYLREGLQAADKEIYIHSEQTEAEFTSHFTAHCPACMGDPDKRRRLDIKQARELYYPEGVFDPWYMDGAVNGYWDYTQQDGPNNLRAVAEMAWAIDAVPPGVEHLFAYESRLNYFVRDRTVISLCLYNITRISGETIMNVLHTHPFTISGGVITQNPYFIHPDTWLAQNAPQFLGKKPAA
jgi:hypothetical protein